MPRVSHFDESAIAAIRELIRRELGTSQGGQGPIRSRGQFNDNLAIVRGAIGAGSTAAPASSTSCSFLFTDGSSYASTTVGDSVYHVGSIAISSDATYPAFRDRLSGKWISAPSAPAHTALFVEFTLSAALATTDATGSASVSAYWGGADPDPSSAGLTVYNLSISANYLFEGDNGDVGLAVWDERRGNYRIWQLECP